MSQSEFEKNKMLKILQPRQDLQELWRTSMVFLVLEIGLFDNDHEQFPWNFVNLK